MTLYKSSVLLSEVYCTMKQLSFLFVKSTLKTLKSIHKNKEENQGKVTLQILFAYSWSARSILSSLGSLLYLCVYLNSTRSETNSSNSSFGSSISQTKREKRVTKSVIYPGHYVIFSWTLTLWKLLLVGYWTSTFVKGQKNETGSLQTNTLPISSRVF